MTGGEKKAKTTRNKIWKENKQKQNKPNAITALIPEFLSFKTMRGPTGDWGKRRRKIKTKAKRTKATTKWETRK